LNGSLCQDDFYYEEGVGFSNDENAVDSFVGLLEGAEEMSSYCDDDDYDDYDDDDDCNDDFDDDDDCNDDFDGEESELSLDIEQLISFLQEHKDEILKTSGTISYVGFDREDSAFPKIYEAIYFCKGEHQTVLLDEETLSENLGENTDKIAEILKERYGDIDESDLYDVMSGMRNDEWCELLNRLFLIK
jgi:hypothetical protein